MSKPYKCYFVGGPLDGMTMIKHNMNDRVSCVNEPIQHFNAGDSPISPAAPAPKVGNYMFVDELKIVEEFPPFYRHMIMGWKG